MLSMTCPLSCVLFISTLLFSELFVISSALVVGVVGVSVSNASGWRKLR